MIILDLTIFSIQKVGGISVVWSEYLKRLRAVGVDLEYLLLYPGNENRIASELDLSEYDVCTIKPRGVISKYLPFLLVGNRNDILHVSYYQWYPLYRGLKIVTLHDFMHEKYASFKSRILHNILKFLSLNSADVILCISEATKADLKIIYPNIYLKKDVRVIENAASDDFYFEAVSPVVKRNFLWVAGRSGYKNFKYALSLLSYLKKRGELYRLSVVGSELTCEEKKCAEFYDVLDLVKVYSNVSVTELRVMYSNALALLYLSKYEGFGLPILEAQKCLCPVVALRNPASIEVGRDSILYIDNDNEKDIDNVIKKITDSWLRDRIVKDGMKNSRRYDWNTSVKKVVDVYMEYQGLKNIGHT